MTDTTETAARSNGAADLSDLSSSPADEGRVMEVRNKLGEIMRHADGRPFTITLYGAESAKFRSLAMAQQDRRNQRVFRTRAPDKPQVAEREAIELLVAATKDWDIVWDKAPLEFSEEKAREIYSKFTFLRDQVDQFVGNAANFTIG